MRYKDIARHVDHDIVCVEYVGVDNTAANVSIECITCGEVIFDMDRP